MKTNVNQRDLLATLKLHKSVIDKSVTYKKSGLFSNVQLLATGSTLWVRSMNDGVELLTTIPCEGDGGVTVNGIMLTDLVKAAAPLPKGKAPASTIVLALADDTLSIAGMAALTMTRAMTTVIDSLPPGHHGPLREPAVVPFELPLPVVHAFTSTVNYDSAMLADAIDFVLPAVSTDETRYHLNGACFDGENLVSTDGHRLHKFAGLPATATPFTVSRLALFPLAGVVGAKGVTTARASIGPKVVQFEAGNATLTVRRSEERFPPYEQVIPSRDYLEGGFTAKRVSFLRSLKSAMRVASDRTYGVKISVSGTELFVEADDPDRGSAKAPFEGIARTPAKPWRLGVNAAYLIEALDSMDADEIGFWNDDSELSPIRMDHGPRTAVVMPMRL